MPTRGDDNVLALRIVRNKMLAKKLDFLKDCQLVKDSVHPLHNSFETNLEEGTAVEESKPGDILKKVHQERKAPRKKAIQKKKAPQ